MDFFHELVYCLIISSLFFLFMLKHYSPFGSRKELENMGTHNIVNEYDTVQKQLPLSVAISSVLVFISILLYIPIVCFNVYYKNFPLYPGALITTVTPILIYSLIPLYIRRGSNKARILYIVLSILINNPAGFHISGIVVWDSIKIVQSALIVFSIILLVLPISNKWFKKLRELSKQEKKRKKTAYSPGLSG